MELIVPPAPIEIGNRVWLDANSNGIQDADEAGIPNVQVQLVSGGTTVATATTAADGTYYFSNATGTSTTSKIYGISQLQPNIAYTIHFPPTVPVSGTNYSLTTANAGSNTAIDSNALASGDVTVATTDIPVAGANNHSFDVGYASTPTCPTITVTPNPLTAGTVGSAYTASPVASASDSGSYTYTWTVSGLPAGLAVDSGTGAVSGTPTATGNATITATTTVAGQTCTGTTTLAINAAPTGNLTITKSVTGGTDPQTFSLQLDCSDNTFDNPTIQLTAGQTHTVNNIPTGTTCTVTETPPSPPVGYSYSSAIITPAQPVTIGNGTTVAVTVENPLNPVSCPTITVTPNPLTAGTVGSAYTASPSASASDSGSYTYTWTASSLPAGLAVDSGSGAVSGTPTATGTATITATTTVAGQTCSGTTALTINANPKADLELNKTVDKSTARRGDTINYTITITNKGPGAATGVIVTDKLPSGLTYVSDNGQSTYGSDVYDENTGLWSVGDVANGESKPLTITATVN